MAGVNYKITADNEDFKRKFNESKQVIVDSGKTVQDTSDKIKRSVEDSAKSVDPVIKGFQQLEKVGQETMKNLTKATQATELKEQLTIQKQVIADLEEQYRRYRAEFDKLNVGYQTPEQRAAKETAKKLFQQAKAELDAETKALTHLEKEYDKLGKTINRANASRSSSLVQMRNIRNEMIRLREAGLQETDRYRELQTELKRVGTSYRAVMQEQKLLTTAGNAHIAGLIQGIQGLSGAFAVSKGVMALFVKDNEKLAAVQTKLQAAMAITIGLQQVSTTLHQTSTFRMVTLAKASQLYAAATDRVSAALVRMKVAQSAANTAAKVGVGIIGGVLIAAVAAGVIIWNRYSKAQKEAKEQAEKLAASQKTVSDAFLEGTKGAQSELTRLTLLHKATTNLNKSVSERTKAAEELRRLYPEQFRNFTNEEMMAGRTATAYKNLAESILSVARAKAAESKITENEKKRLDLEEQRAQIEAKIRENEAEIARIKARRAEVLTEPEVDPNVMLGYSVNIKAMESDIKEFNKSISNTTEEIQALEQANIDLANTIKVTDLISGDKKTDGKTAAQKDYTDQIEREKREKIRLYEDMEFSVRQAEIDAMNDGVEKLLIQNQLNHEREIAQLRRQKEDKLAKIQQWERTIWESQNPNWESQGLKFTPTTTQLSPQEGAQYDMLEAAMLKKYEAANKAVLHNLVNEYGSYYEKRVLLTEKWEKKIAGLPAKYHQEAMAQMHRELADLDSSYIKTTTAISRLFEDASRKSVAEIRKITSEAEKMKDFILAGSWDAEQGAAFGITESQFRALNEEWARSPEKLDAIRRAIRGLDEEANNSENAFRKLSRGLKEVFAAGKNSDALKNGLADVQKGLEEINSLVQDVGNNVATLFDAFGKEDNAELVSNITNIASGAMQAGTGIAQLASGDIIGGIKNLAAGLTNVVVSITRIGDGKKEKDIKRLQKQVEALGDAYDKLGKAINKAYSTEAVKLIHLQDENLRKQREIIEEQMRLEKDKKKTDKSKIREYEAALKDIDEALEQTKDLVIEAIIGRDVLSAIDEFAQAYMDAWSGGGDKAASVKEVVRNMVKSAVAELVKSRLSGEVENFMNYLAEAMKDGILTVAEQNTLDALEAAIYNKLEDFDSSLDKYVKDKIHRTQDSTRRGFEAMTQDQASELSGRFAGLQMAGEEIKSDTGAILMDVSEIRRIAVFNNEAILDLRDMGLDTVFYLKEINKNTAQLYEMNTRLGKIEENTRRL